MVDQRGFEPRPLAHPEAEILTERPRDHQDVREQDRAVEAEPADRLERHLGRGVGIGRQREKSPLLGPQSAIFGEIAPRLPHEPQRRHGLTLPAKSRQEGLGGGRIGGRIGQRSTLLLL
jgi:hypothetical protein